MSVFTKKKSMFSALLNKLSSMTRSILLAFSFILATSLFAQTSLLFDGVDEYVSSPFAGITGANDRTVEAWVKTSANTNSSQRVVVDWGVFSTGTRFTLNILNGVARVEVSGGGLNGTTTITDGQWHHLAVTFDNSSSQPYSIYVDGDLEAEGTLSNNPTTNTSAGNFRIGARIDNVRYFLGEIDEVRVWDDVRTNAEIAANMNSILTGNEPGLAAYFNMEGTTNTVGGVIDLAAGNNGTMINMEPGDIISTVPLPIELVSFKATYQDNQQAVLLEWETLSEVDNDFFSIERSHDGNAWNEVKQVDGAGDSNAKQRYSAIDASPFKGDSYYRLKQTDFDGKASFSDVLNVSIQDSKNNLVVIYPNPTRGNVTLTESTIEVENVEVYTSTGQLLLLPVNYRTDGSIQLDLSSFASGMYFIKSGNEMSRVIKE